MNLEIPALQVEMFLFNIVDFDIADCLLHC